VKRCEGTRAQTSSKDSVRKKRDRVEATEGCGINPDKYAKRAQVHKFRETNFVDLH
jgi:hypothetical protein